MIEIIIFLIINLTIFFVSSFLINKKLLLSQSGEHHQQFVEKSSVPLILGFYFLLTFTYVFIDIVQIYFLFFLFLIFTLGFFSDIKIINSPKKRFFLQALILIIFIYFLDIRILDSRIEFINIILKNNIFNFLFVLFCLMVLVNGTNFIDGLNGLVIGYYLIISLFLIHKGFFDYSFLSANDIYIYFLTFFIMLVANFRRKGFLGDSGSYLLGAFFGVLMIKFHQKFEFISPYYIILLLWYPCFENLFSIIRKFSLNRSPIFPDNNHFHQLVFYCMKKRFNFNDIYSNNISSTVILLFASLFIYLGSLNPYSTILQIFLLFIFSILYFFIYMMLLKFKLNTNK